VSRGKAEAALLFNVVVWGATFVLIKSALREISPVLFLAMRFSLAAVALVVLFGRKFQGAKAPRIWQADPEGTPPAPPTGKMLAAGGMIGVFLFAGFLLQTMGLRLTTAPKSAFLTGLATVMVPLLGALVYKIKPRVSEVAGVLAATAGMGLMTLDGPLGSIGRGDLLTFGGAIAFSAHIVATGHFAERIGYEVLSVAQVGAAALSALSLVWWVETPRVHWQPLVVWAILITGLLCTALAFTIQAWAQHYTTSTRTALIYALEPVVAWITSFCLAGEGLSGQAAAGAALILSGVLLVELKPFHARQHL
jgi:drug/metabolite transporter (DMT)-like permease